MVLAGISKYVPYLIGQSFEVWWQVSRYIISYWCQ